MGCYNQHLRKTRFRPVHNLEPPHHLQQQYSQIRYRSTQGQIDFKNPTAGMSSSVLLLLPY